MHPFYWIQCDFDSCLQLSGDFVSSPDNVRLCRSAGKENTASFINGGNIAKQTVNEGKGVEASIRSSFTHVFSCIKTIKPNLGKEHIREFHKSPFRHLIICFLNGYIKEEHVVNIGSDIREVVRCFDTRKKCFSFGGVEAVPTIDDFRCVFGIEDGLEEVVVSNKFTATDFYWRQPLFMTRRGEDIRLNSTIVKAQLEAKVREEPNEHTHKDVARLLTLFIMSALLLTPPSGRMPWIWVEMLDNYDELKRFAWAKYIRQTTMNSLENGKKQYGGCPLFFLFWLCDNTDIMPCLNSRFWPRILKWNLSHLNKLIKQRKIQISTLGGFRWTGSAPVCKCEWEKLDCPHLVLMYEECNHGGDTYVGEASENEKTGDSCREGDCYMCMEENNPSGFQVQTMNANETIYVQKITEGVCDSLDAPYCEELKTPVSNHVFQEEQGIAGETYTASTDTVDKSGDSSSGNEGSSGYVTSLNVCDGVGTIGSPSIAPETRNPFVNASQAYQKLFGWGVKGSEKTCRKLEYSPVDSGYEADDGELPDYVYDKLSSDNQADYVVVDRDTVSDMLTPMSQVVGYEFLNTHFLDNLGYSMRAVVSYIEGFGRGDPRVIEVAREFFHRKRDVDILLSKLEDMEVELDSVLNEFKTLLPLESELNMLKLENSRLRKQVMACKCKRILKPKPAKAFKKKYALAYRPSLTAKVMPRGRNTTSGARLNSLIKWVKERANRQRKRISGYTYHSQVKITKKKRSKKVVAIPMDMGGLDGGVDEDNFIHILEHIKVSAGLGGKVWRGAIAGDPVIVKEAESILKGEAIVDTVVNGWGEIVVEDDDGVRVINAGCLDFITHVNENNEGTRLYIDPVLESFKTCRKMMFQINPNGRHWTLLVFDLTENKWTHYNSMLPSVVTEDQYLKASNIVKEYVENKIMEIIMRNNCGTVFEKSGLIEAVLDTPQQSYASLDCGIFVCIIIERLVLGRDPTATITLEDVAKYRRRMVHVFVDRGVKQE